MASLPTTKELNSAFSNEPFIIKRISERPSVKGMKFPILGIKGDSEEEFKTYGKFKKSEQRFDYFKEKVTPNSRFEVLVSDDSPIHVQKKINRTPFDVDLKRWKHLDGATDICKKINQRYSPEFYLISIIEANGDLYLESIDRKGDLTPSQEFALYESAYSKYYSSKLPTWFKTQAFNDYVKPYYVKKHYDSLLFKPTGTINYERYLS